MKLLNLAFVLVATHSVAVVAETDKQLPAVSVNSGIELLLPAQHPNVLNKNQIETLTRGQWYSLYQPKGQLTWQYKKTKVTAKVVSNDCWGDALNIASRHDSEYSLLIKGLTRSEGDVASVEIPAYQHVFWPGESFSFSFNNHKYTLSASGQTEEQQQQIRNENKELVASGDVTNYRFYLSDGSGKKQLLIERPHLNLDTIVRLQFIGDVDGDNKPDLVFDVKMSNDYERTEVVLFLSSHAKQEQFVGAVALAVHDFAC